MSSRVPVLAGVLSGVIAGAVILAAVVAYGPEPGTARLTASPPAPATAPGGSVPGSTATPAASPPPASASGSPAASGTAGPAATGTIMHIGERAPVLAVPQVGGGSIDLSQLRGRPVWVMFLTTTCAGCRDEMTLMNGFLARYGSAGLVILAIDVKEDEGTVATFAKRVTATFPFGLDLEGSAQREWDVLGLPAHFWVDTAGVIRDAVPGIAGPAGMVHGLQQILPGVTVTP